MRISDWSSDVCSSDLATAFNFVNMIREARGLEELLPEETDYTNKEFMMDMIFRERAREFAFEGKRWYDLMFWSELSGRNVLAEKVSDRKSTRLNSSH